MFDAQTLKRFESYDRHGLASGGPLALAGALLREPGQLLRDLGSGERIGARAAGLLVVSVAFCAGYGAILGFFGGGLQALLAAGKLPIIVSGSALLCTPTLYVFNALSGSRLNYLQTVALALLMASALDLMLFAFASIVGLRTLNVARRYLEFRGGHPVLGTGLFLLWSLMALLVGLQMAWWFRPLMVEGPFHLGQRGLFLEFLRFH